LRLAACGQREQGQDAFREQTGVATGGDVSHHRVIGADFDDVHVRSRLLQIFDAALAVGTSCREGGKAVVAPINRGDQDQLFDEKR